MWRLLYWFDKRFRQLLATKLANPNDQVATGETIIVIIKKGIVP